MTLKDILTDRKLVNDYTGIVVYDEHESYIKTGVGAEEILFEYAGRNIRNFSWDACGRINVYLQGVR